MFVKICGITNKEDAFAAVDAGARALGFIFYERSPRFVSPAQLSPWIDELPADIWRVGVYVNESPAAITEISEQLHLDIAQLHGNETPDQYPQSIRIWKALRLEPLQKPLPESSESNVAHALVRAVSRLVSTPSVANLGASTEAVLLDGPGNGQTFDWAQATQFTNPALTKVIIAGGLTPENVRAAIEQTNPWGVDTASGVEASPGRKDHARMKSFIKAALRS